MNTHLNGIRKPIFICGCHRTGTTLLRTVLTRHTKIDILPETKLFAWQYHPFQSIRSVDANAKWSEITTLMPFINRAWRLPENEQRLRSLRESSAPAGFQSIGSLMRHVLSHGSANAEFVGEKSPLHIYFVDQLLEEFSDARILILQRDLRGAFHSQSSRSLRNQFSHRKFNVFNFVSSWTIAANLSQKYLTTHGRDKIQIVNFEKLVQDPLGTLEGVCDFLDIEFESNMIEVDFENSSFANSSKRSGINSETADRWRTQQEQGVSQRLERLADNEMKIAGYQNTACMKTKPSDFLMSKSVRIANAVAIRNPQMVCYLGRDPRYLRLTREYELGNFSNLNGPTVVVLGNHKSGTTAIAKLLSKMCQLTETIDFPRNIRKDGYALIRRELTVQDVVNRHPSLFCKDIVKIPALTFFGQEVADQFPAAKFVFIVRDPRDNIRSILNRRNIVGDRKELPVIKRTWSKVTGKPSMDPSVWGQSDAGYVGVLANRWNQAITALDKMTTRPNLIRYEDFVSDKQTTLDQLALKLELKPQVDVSHLLDVQFQPAGNKSVDWKRFYGEANLEAIEKICGPEMQRFGYQLSDHEKSH